MQWNHKGYWLGYACALGNAFSATTSWVIVDRMEHVPWAVIDFYFIPAGSVVRQGREETEKIGG